MSIRNPCTRTVRTCVWLCAYVRNQSPNLKYVFSALQLLHWLGSRSNALAPAVITSQPFLFSIQVLKKTGFYNCMPLSDFASRNARVTELIDERPFSPTDYSFLMSSGLCQRSVHVLLSTMKDHHTHKTDMSSHRDRKQAGGYKERDED